MRNSPFVVGGAVVPLLSFAAAGLRPADWAGVIG
jgi:hypothetical protein